MTTSTNLVCWVTLSGPTVDGEAIPIPARHRGLSWASMADLGAAQHPPVADLVGKGLWRVYDDAKPALSPGKTHSGPVYTPDAETSTVTRSWTVVNLSVAARKVAMKAAVKALYRTHADAGTTLTISEGVTTPIATTTDPVVKLERGKAHMEASSLSSMAVVTSADVPLDLTPALAAAALGVIDSHVAFCEGRQNALYVAIDAAADHDALDTIESGMAAGWSA
ncbi:hypothetical protein [Thalassobaculum sp.]|uniref:hypothetical protein n=1 Tax=Thalassobaculum sp. TaxID=2022740 RepID=UPI0032EC08B0